jgi:hypothetical protein
MLLKLLKKPFITWTEEEKEEFGNKDQLRKKEEQLRELLILKEKENHQLQGISKPTVSFDVISLSRTCRMDPSGMYSYAHIKPSLRERVCTLLLL